MIKLFKSKFVTFELSNVKYHALLLTSKIFLGKHYLHKIDGSGFITIETFISSVFSLKILKAIDYITYVFAQFFSGSTFNVSSVFIRLFIFAFHSTTNPLCNIVHYSSHETKSTSLQKLVFHFRKCSCHAEIESFVESDGGGYGDVGLKNSDDDHKTLIHYRLT